MGEIREVTIRDMRFEVLTAVKMPMLVFWVATPCGFLGRYQRFGDIYYLSHEDGDSMFLRYVGICLQDHTAFQFRSTT
jgi:hypothetical protein